MPWIRSGGPGKRARRAAYAVDGVTGDDAAGVDRHRGEGDHLILSRIEARSARGRQRSSWRVATALGGCRRGVFVYRAAAGDAGERRKRQLSPPSSWASFETRRCTEARGAKGIL